MSSLAVPGDAVGQRVATAPETSTVVEVFADVACPFTHVGLRRFAERRTLLGRDDVVVRVRSWPLEIVNGTPLAPRHVADEVDELTRGVAPDLFTGFRPDRFPSTTMPALALAAAAYDIDLVVGETVSLELRDLLFEGGVDISRTDALARVARRHDVPFDPHATARVLRDHAEGVRRGVIGSPHFFTSAGSFFCPALDIRRDQGGQLHISADREGFERFLAGCFG